MANPFDDTAKTRYRRIVKRGIRAIPQYEVFTLSRATDLDHSSNGTRIEASKAKPKK